MAQSFANSFTVATSFHVMGASAGATSGSTVVLEPAVVAIAGFTGRDQEAVAEHLAELAELGVPTPASTPCFYQTAATTLIQTDTVVVVRPDTSGEAECVLLVDGDEVWLTVGSDHTDRAAETIDIPISKIMCPKPVARSAWRLSDIADRVESFELRSWITDDDGDEVLYQEGTVGDFMRFDELLARVPFRDRPSTFVLFTGTLAAIGGIRPAAQFRAELRDPSTGDAIELRYHTLVTDLLDI